MKINKNCFFVTLLITFITVVVTSCTEYKDVPYFRDISDHAQDSVLNAIPYKDPTIKPDDILEIPIVTIDPTTAAPVNQSSGMVVSSQLNGASTIVPGLLVDKDGNVSFPIIGLVKVAGLTTSEAKKIITEKASQYFKDPDVQVRFANFTITVLGEVAHPATFLVPSERVSVLDALSMAGDLTIYGKRDNVLVIRDVEGQKQITRLNLNNSNIFQSPYFYLKQNDVVYVEPNKQKAIAADASRTRTYTILAAVATIIIVLVSRVSIK